jgi:hypothetical protein
MISAKKKAVGFGCPRLEFTKIDQSIRRHTSPPKIVAKDLPDLIVDSLFHGVH